MRIRKRAVVCLARVNARTEQDSCPTCLSPTLSRLEAQFLFRCVSIGGVVFGIEAHNYPWELSSADLLSLFLLEELVDPDIQVSVRCAWDPSVASVDEVFRAGYLGASELGWSLSRQQGQWLLRIDHAKSSKIAQHAAILRSDFARGEISLTLHPGVQAPYPYPLEHPLDRLLLINYLPSVGGGLFHACGVDDKGNGLLFVGPQESGKSTLARLWIAQSSAIVLSDECVVVREHGGEYWMYGTPWAGGTGAADSGKVLLSHIFFIAHGCENRLLPVRLLNVVSQLITESFPTFWDRDRMATMLRLCDEIGRNVPCHRLEFLPTPDVVDFVRQVL